MPLPLPGGKVGLGFAREAEVLTSESVESPLFEVDWLKERSLRALETRGCVEEMLDVRVLRRSFFLGLVLAALSSSLLLPPWERSEGKRRSRPTSRAQDL